MVKNGHTRAANRVSQFTYTASATERAGNTVTTTVTYRVIYRYNWGTSRTGVNYYWRIGVRLDDSQTYTVNIELR